MKFLLGASSYFESLAYHPEAGTHDQKFCYRKAINSYRVCRSSHHLAKLSNAPTCLAALGCDGGQQLKATGTRGSAQF